MAGIKSDLIFSCVQPILCDACRVDANSNQITKEFLQTFQHELNKIRKLFYYQIADLVKRNPTIALLLSFTAALVIGIVSSLIASNIMPPK